MTKEEFQKDGPRRQRLRRLLTDLDFVIASQVALATLEARTGDADVNPVLAASRYQQRAGANKFLDELRQLTEDPPERKPLRTPALAKTKDDIPQT